MIFGTKLNENIAKRTAKGLKEFRAKNWDTSVSKDEAYKKYLELYEEYQTIARC